MLKNGNSGKKCRSRKGRLLSILVSVAMLFSVFSTGGIGAYAEPSPGTNLTVSDLTTEYMENPLGLDRAPVFSWKIANSDRGVLQTSYKVSVKNASGSEVWDSGTVTSRKNSGILYEGATLAAGADYSWTVTVRDNKGNEATSASANFSMGLLSETDWNNAQWISNTGGTAGTGDLADPEVFTIDCDFQLDKGSLGLIFGRDKNNFYMMQLNTGDSQDERLLFRPHRWVNNSGAVMGQYDITASTGITNTDIKTGTHHLKVSYNHARFKLWLDDKLITYETGFGGTASRAEDYIENNEITDITGLGFRAFYNPNNSDQDELYIDKLVKKDSKGVPVYYDDFTATRASGNSLDNGTLTNGKLYLKPTGTGNTEWRVWQKAADANIYSAEADIKIDACATGLVLGANDAGSNLYMWQLNTFDHAGETWLRPHVLYNGGWSEYGNERNINSNLPAAQAEGQFNTLRVDVEPATAGTNRATLTSYVNGTQVDSRDTANNRRYAMGNIGFRQAQDALSTVPETGTIDRIMLRDTGGRVVYYDDFEDGINRYGGDVTNGALTIKKEGGKEIFLRDNSAQTTGASKVPLLRKDFDTEDKTIRRATVYASALGHYELQLNGAKVGEDYMAPGWTEYATRVQYQTYDVTSQVKKGGANSLGAMLAPGWYSGNISILGKNRYGSDQCLIANLIIEYTDGTKQTVVTDDTWKYSMKGPIVETDMFDGEQYDARKEIGDGKYGWVDPSVSLSDWGIVGVKYTSAYGAKTQGKTVALTAQIGPTVGQIESVTPVSVNKVGEKYIVDMGQNFAGLVELSLKGAVGTTATIRYGEMLNDAANGVRGCDNSDGAGSLYTANLRSAKATDKYIFKSNEKETWTPNFTFHGFRYVEIAGVSEAPVAGDIKGIALGNRMARTGTFTSTDDTLNQIYSNAYWGQLSNFLSVPTDCPQRDERMGWGADTIVFTKTGLYNRDATMFYRKWLQDVRDGQGSNGSYGAVSPNPHPMGFDIVWSAGGVLVPYMLWQTTGDTRFVTDGYDSMKRYMDYLNSGSLIKSCGYGDWLEPVDNTSDKEVIGTTYYAYQLSLMAEMAEAIGRTEDADACRVRFAGVNVAFHDRFVSGGTISNDIQSGYVLALSVGLYNDETEPLFAAKLAERIERDGGLMSVGFVSVNKLMPVLEKYGYTGTAYHLARSHQYPSWGYSIDQGATTIWERWNSYTKENGFGPVSMNSFNHYSFGSVCEWFYSGIAGIKTDSKNPGFDNVIIQPAIDGSVEGAGATYNSIKGDIKSYWKNTSENHYKFDVTIPANATATVVLPATISAIKENDTFIVNASSQLNGIDGITKVSASADGENTEITIGSGSYSFTLDWTGPVNKLDLLSAIQAAKKKISVYEDFTAASVNPVRAAITVGERLLEREDATQEDIDNQTESLRTAVAALTAGTNVNLAAGKPATASTQVSSTTFAARNISDGKRSGDGSTTWSSGVTNANGVEWIYINLQAATAFNRILVFPRDDGAPSGYGFPRSFTVEISDDGQNWTPILARTDYPYVGTDVQRFTFPAGVTARYVRMKSSAIWPNPGDGNTYRMQLAEIEIYNITDAFVDKDQLLSLLKEARKLNEDEYTDESWTDFAEARKDAEEIYADNGATDAAVTDAYHALATAMQALERPVVAKSANWIWYDEQGTTPVNTWVAFRKNFSLTAAQAALAEVQAEIAADSKYWMYINDKLVVFEGSLKRGPNPQDTYVDKLNIASYLKEGDNNISILVYHYGKSGYSGGNSGKGGLYFNATAGTEKIISNQSWKLKKFDAYGKMANDPNYRLLESNIRYNATSAIPMEGWNKLAYEDTAWSAATVYGLKGVAPWNAFVDRPIPFFKFDKDYRIFGQTAITTTAAIGNMSLYKVPVDEYILTTKLKVVEQPNSCAFGIVFGYQNASNFNMWQIYCSNPVHDPNVGGNPYLKPHLKVNGGWTTPGAQPRLTWVPQAEWYTHDYEVELKVQGGQVTTTVDGNIIDTRAVTLRGGAVGFRADSNEKGIAEYIKVTSLDGQTVYIDDDFNGALKFDNATIEGGKLVVGGRSNDVSVSQTGEETTKYTCALPVNVQLTPYLKVNANAAGKVIHIYTDKTAVADGPALEAEYVTKAGEQSYESLVWMNGEKLYFDIPEGVEVLELGYRQSGYNAAFEGSFKSDDAFVNSLWTKSRDTLYVTMRDNFMDCPDREKAQWWGDAVNEMQMAFYALSTDANLLAKKGIGNVLGYVRNGILPTVAPIGGSDFYELPAQSLAGITSYYLYYLYTGDVEVVEDAYLPSYTYLMKNNTFTMGADGVVQHRNGQWNWSDWGSNSDQKLITNTWYYLALDRTVKMADALGKGNSLEVQEMTARMDSIKANFDTVFWNAGGFYRTPGVGITDDRGNAMAVFSGLASKERYAKIRDVLKTTMWASPYMEKYVLEALYMMGYDEDAMARMKTRYAPMVESDLTTLWEFWDPNSGTQNHAWTGGPLTMMSMYAAGVSPIEPGYKKFGVVPQLGTLKKIDTVVPTVKGEIEVHIDGTATDQLTLSTTVPAGTKALVGVPLIGETAATEIYYKGDLVWRRGVDVAGAALASVSQDEDFVYYEADEDITFKAISVDLFENNVSLIAALRVVVDMAKTIDTSRYSDDQVVTFTEALTSAQAILAAPTKYTDDEIISAGIALIEATDGMNTFKVDKAILKSYIDYAAELIKNEDKYVPVSIANLKEKSSSAAAIYSDNAATQAQIDAAANALLTAITQVYEKGDKGALLALYTLVSKYPEATYTPASWKTFDTARKAAKAVLDNANAVNTQVEDAYTALTGAIIGLMRKANFAALNASVQLAQSIVGNIDDYIPSTVVGLAEELTAAKSVAENPNATQTEVNAATAALNAKVLAARLKPDLSGLIQSLQRAGSYNLTEFTKASADKVTIATEEGSALLSAPIEKVEQAAVDTATEKINVAITNLVRKTETATNVDGKTTVSGETQVLVPAVKIAGVKAGSKKVVVKWKKAASTAQVAGYQIQYRVKGTAKWKTKTVSAKSASLTIKSLKKNKKYQVRIRAYRTVAGTKYYGVWSGAAVSKKTK